MASECMLPLPFPAKSQRLCESYCLVCHVTAWLNGTQCTSHQCRYMIWTSQSRLSQRSLWTLRVPAGPSWHQDGSLSSGGFGEENRCVVPAAGSQPAVQILHAAASCNFVHCIYLWKGLDVSCAQLKDLRPINLCVISHFGLSLHHATMT